MLYFDEYGNRENPTILLLHGAAALDTFCMPYCFSTQKRKPIIWPTILSRLLCRSIAPSFQIRWILRVARMSGRNGTDVGDLRELVAVICGDRTHVRRQAALKLLPFIFTGGTATPKCSLLML